VRGEVEVPGGGGKSWFLEGDEAISKEGSVRVFFGQLPWRALPGGGCGRWSGKDGRKCSGVSWSFL